MKCSVIVREMMTTLINFYIGVARLTVLLPFTVVRAWKLSMEYPDYLEDDQVYDDEENSYYNGDDPESKLALSEVEADSSFEDEHTPNNTFLGWGSESLKTSPEENGLNFSWLWNWGWPKEYKDTGSTWGLSTKQQDGWSRSSDSGWGWKNREQNNQGWGWGGWGESEQQQSSSGWWDWGWGSKPAKSGVWGQWNNDEESGWNWGRSQDRTEDSSAWRWSWTPGDQDGGRWQPGEQHGGQWPPGEQLHRRSQSLRRTFSPSRDSRQELEDAEQKFRAEQRRSASQPNIKYKNRRSRSQSPEEFNRLILQSQRSREYQRNLRSKSRSLSPPDTMPQQGSRSWSWWGWPAVQSSASWTDPADGTRSRRSRSGSPSKTQDRTRSKALRRWETREIEHEEDPSRRTPEKDESAREERRPSLFGWRWNWAAGLAAAAANQEQQSDGELVDFDVDDDDRTDDKLRLVSFTQQDNQQYIERQTAREKSISPGQDRRGILRTRSPTVKSVKVAELKQKKEAERLQRRQERIREAAAYDTDSTVNEEPKPVRTLIDRWNKHVEEKEALKLSFKVSKKLSPKMSRKISPRGSFSRATRSSLGSPRQSFSSSPRSSVRHSPRSSYKIKSRKRTSLAEITARFEEKYGKDSLTTTSDTTARDDSPLPPPAPRLDSSGIPVPPAIGSLKPLAPGPTRIPVPVPPQQPKFKIEPKVERRPIEKLNKELLEKVSQRLDFTNRRESISVSKLKEKFEQPKVEETPSERREPSPPSEVKRKLSIGTFENIVQSQKNWIQDSSQKLEKIEQTVDKLTCLVMNSQSSREPSQEQEQFKVVERRDTDDALIIIDQMLDNIERDNENQANNSGSSVEEGIEAEESDTETALHLITEENTSGAETDEGNLDVTTCLDSDDSQLLNSADESQIMNSADEIDEPRTEDDTIEETDRILTTATVQLHHTETDYEAQEKILNENIELDHTVESGLKLEPIQTIDNDVEITTDTITTAAVDEGITDVMTRDGDDNQDDLDKIQVVQVISDFNKEKRLEKKLGSLSKIKSKIFPRKEVSSFQKNLSSSLESLVLNAPSADIYRSVSRISLSGADGYENNLYQPSFSRSEIVLKVDSDIKRKCDCSTKNTSSGSPKRFGRKQRTPSSSGTTALSTTNSNQSRNKCGAVEACCPNIKGIKRKLGARHLVPNGEDAFGDKDVTIKFFHKTVDL